MRSKTPCGEAHAPKAQTNRIVAQLALGVEPSFVLQAKLARFGKELSEGLSEHLRCKPIQNQSQITRVGT